MRRVFITSPPGCNRHATASAIAENFEWKFISASDAILAEGEKDTPEGQEILKATKKFRYVDDELVINLVNKEIQEAEKLNKSWILEGFPRTRVQAHAFAKLGVVPDKLIQMSCSKECSMAHIKNSVLEINGKLTKK